MQVHSGQRWRAIESAQAVVTRHDLDLGGYPAPQLRDRLDRSDGKGVDRRANRVDLRMVREQAESFPMSGLLTPRFICTHDMTGHPGFLNEASVDRFGLDVGVSARRTDHQRDVAGALCAEVRVENSRRGGLMDVDARELRQ